MKKNSLTTAVVAGIAGVAGFAGLANAVHLNPDGLGQVLLYPYYTVNSGQQTLLSVVNTAGIAKAVKVRFLEGYNTREVLDFNLFLSPYDVWTATVFSLSDAGKPGAGAAILSRDRSCTAPRFTESGTTLTDGTPYVSFVNFAYAGTNDDTGPTGTARTREGHFEIISMADMTGALATAVTHTGASQTPPNCNAVRPNTIIGNANFIPPTSGLFGGAAVVDTAEGTLYTYNADALDRFTNVQLFTGTANVLPNLASVNDVFLSGAATANVFTGTGVTTSTYGGPGVTTSRPIDAVSAIFSADAIYNEYTTSATVGAESDWVVTFPTKSFYVDPVFAGAVARAPFEELFGEIGDGQSCVAIGLTIYDREELTQIIVDGFSPPPPGDPGSTLCKEVNVISFIDTDVAPTESGVLGSTLVSNVRPTIGANGWLKLDLDKNSDHTMSPALNGNVWNGLPVSGFWANSLVNNQATVINGVSVLSNYSGVFKHRVSRDCIRTGNLACS